MAASPSFGRQRIPHSSLYPRNARGEPLSASVTIPRGPCNWRDLNQGPCATTCGCQRFWARSESIEEKHVYHAGQSQGSDQGTLCFCGHHACYHQESQAPSSSRASQNEARTLHARSMPPPSGVNNKRSGDSPPSRGVSSQQHDQAYHSHRRTSKQDEVFSQYTTAHRRGSVQAPSHNNERTRDAEQPGPSGLGLYIEQTRNPPFAEKLSAAAQFAASQLPPTRTPSRQTSVATSRQGREMNASAAHIFPDPVASSRNHALGLNIPQVRTGAGVTPEDYIQSATELATPTDASTPALRAADDVKQQIKTGVEQLYQDVAKIHTSPDFTRLRSPQTRTIPRSTRAPREELAHASPLSNAKRVKRLPETPTIGMLISHVASLRDLLASTPNLGVSLANLGQRVDALESASFTHCSVDDLNDRHELFDSRLIDIESRVEELERYRMDNVGPGGSQSGTESLSRSRSSFRDNAEPHTLQDNHEPSHLGPTPLLDLHATQSDAGKKRSAVERLESIERRLAELTQPPASLSERALTIEVVLLPWGKDLKGIWHDANIASQLPDSAAAGASLAESHSHAQPFGDTQEWPHYSWAPRAIGPTPGTSGRVYERLKSRGFVRNVTFDNDHAREVVATIYKAFGSLLSNQQPSTRPKHDRRLSVHSQSLRPFLALKCPFVPLRKIHKHSRLRFLAESELVTPALWTAPFLESSVFMKAPSAGVTRLFITTPQAYLQSIEDTGWTWQRLRELPRVPHIELNERQDAECEPHEKGVDEADAREPCWEHDPRLDPPPSQQSSFASVRSAPPRQNVSFESSQHPSPPHTKPDAGPEEDEEAQGDMPHDSSEGEFNDLSSVSAGSREHLAHLFPITPVSDFFASSRPSMIDRRAASFPAAVPALSSSLPHITVVEEPHPKRQVASFDDVLVPSSIPEAGGGISRPLSAQSKRRRLSRTPSGRELNVDRDGPWGLTPGQSVHPGSPAYGHEDNEHAEAGMQELQETTKVPLNDRGQGAYATPYSPPRHARGPHVDNTDINMANNAGSDESDDDIEDDNDDDDGDDSNESDDDQDTDFVVEDHLSVESEMEIDAALMRAEEAWEGVGDGDDEDEGMVTVSAQRAVGLECRAGLRRKASSSRMDVDGSDEGNDEDDDDDDDDDDDMAGGDEGDEEDNDVDDSDGE